VPPLIRLPAPSDGEKFAVRNGAALSCNAGDWRNHQWNQTSPRVYGEKVAAAGW